MTTTTALPELSRKRLDEGGVTCWAIYSSAHAIQIQYVPSLDLVTGVFTCEIPTVGANPALVHDDCPWLGRCTSDAYGTRTTDAVRKRFRELGRTADDDGPDDDAVYVLLAELHAELVTR